MKLTVSLALLIFLAACSETAPETGPPQPSIEDNEAQTEMTDQKTDESTLMLIEEPAVSVEQAAKLEASILTSARMLTKTHAAQNEQANIDELERLSEADRQSLNDESAEATAKAAEQKAEAQAVSAALKSIDQL